MRVLDAEATDKSIAKWAKEVGALFDSVAAGMENAFREAGFLAVGDAVASRISKNTGLDVVSYGHIVDTSSIRHILKHHGTSAEYKRGQVPITKLDFMQLIHLLLNPDTIEYAGKTKQGRDVLRYTKVIGEHIMVYTEEVRTKKGRLAAVTLYKRINKKE